jgi:putative zinc finger protein
MNCEDCRILIEEYFDDELDAHTALAVRHHLDACPSCSSVLQELSAEQSVYAGYQSNVEISSELWAGVRQRLEIDRPATQRFGSWLRNVFTLPPVSGPVAVGLVVLAVVLTVVVMRYLSSSPGTEFSERANTEDTGRPTPEAPDETAAARPGKSETPSTGGSSGKDNATKHTVLTTTGDRRLPTATRSDVHRTKDPRRLVREAEQKYLAAIALLSRNVDRKKSRLDSATAAELDQALTSIDRTIAATRKVVRQHPDDPVAAQYMLTAYAKKVDVLRELVNY